MQVGPCLQAEFLVVENPTKGMRQTPIEASPSDEHVQASSANVQAASANARSRSTSSAPEPRMMVHNSFLDEAIRLRDSRVSTAHVAPHSS